VPFKTYAYNETRYTMLTHSDPETARRRLVEAQEDVDARWRLYEQWAARPARGPAPEAHP
jgi:pyruvate-ferredoxin/flavodoxin oxidoreductase